MINSIVIRTSSIELPLIDGEYSMIPFSIGTLEGLSEPFRAIAENMLAGIGERVGVGFFTIHGKKLETGDTLRRGGPHTDGNYEKYHMSFGGGWKVGENGPPVGSNLHKRQYCKDTGGIIMASNYESCLGYVGEYDEYPAVGGDCSHINLAAPFMLERNTVYYGNNHFIHESLPVADDVHRVLARITMPESHNYSPLY